MNFVFQFVSFQPEEYLVVSLFFLFASATVPKIAASFPGRARVFQGAINIGRPHLPTRSHYVVPAPYFATLVLCHHDDCRRLLYADLDADDFARGSRVRIGHSGQSEEILLFHVILEAAVFVLVAVVVERQEKYAV